MSEQRARIERAMRDLGLSENPAETDSSIHSWRCEHPDRYGPCDCFTEAVDTIMAAIDE